MAAPSDWAFDVQQFFADQFAGRIGFEHDEGQRYPDRITGTLWTGVTSDATAERAVVIPRGVGYENASRFRRWVTLPVLHWENITNRPAGWRFFVLMVGLLPDGQPQWATLYDEQVLASQRDHSENMGRFYRFDPGLTAPALVAEWDPNKPVEPEPLVEPTHPIPADPGDDGGRRPAERRVVKETIDAGVSLMLDQSQMVLLDDAYLAGLQDRVVAAHKNISEWRVVRSKQSNSRAKAAARR